MRLARDNHRRRMSDNSVVTIGNFDSVHRGHRALIECCRAQAQHGEEIVVVTFEPLPQALFSPRNPPARLTGPRQKLELLADLGVDLVWMMRFNRDLANMPARAFAQSVLVDGLAATRVIVGEDFRFGRAREGDLSLLRELGAAAGFAVDVVPTVLADGDRVSSTVIRAALAAGDMGRAERLLGRPFTMQGRVFRGTQLGRKLGYPTANMRPAAEPCPLAGVFAVRTRALSASGAGRWRDGVASLGRRPVVGGTEFLVEVHLFEFDGDLYGQRLETRFVQKLRDEENFKNLEALVEQMKHDEARAREALRQAGPRLERDRTG